MDSNEGMFGWNSYGQDRPVIVVPVPNKPKTPVSTFRIPLDLKEQFKAKAEERGDDMTAVIVKAIERYVKAK